MKRSRSFWWGWRMWRNANGPPYCSARTKLSSSKSWDSLRYKAVVDHTRTLVFEWRGTELNYLSIPHPELLAGNYDGRIPFEVWREDGVLFAGDNAAMDACLSRLALGVKSGETTVAPRRRDGQFIWCKVTYTALADGEPGDRYIGTLNDVDAITRSEQALRQRAELDPLTGAYNTQTFFEKVESLLKKNPEKSLRRAALRRGGLQGP